MLTPLEQKVLDMILDLPGEPYAALRQQLEVAVVTKREFTGVGFFTSFAIPDSVSVPRNVPNSILDDVAATIEGRKYGICFMLFVRDGVMSTLEGVTLAGDDWPEEPFSFNVYRLVSWTPKRPWWKFW